MFSPETLAVLETYPWPGNVRELKNFVERMLILAGGREITPDRLPPDITSQATVSAPSAATPPTPPVTTPVPTTPLAGTLSASVDAAASPDAASLDVDIPDTFQAGPLDLKAARAAFEARFLEAKLREFGGNVSKLAEAVGLDRSSLYRKLKGYGIQAE